MKILHVKFESEWANPSLYRAHRGLLTEWQFTSSK